MESASENLSESSSTFFDSPLLAAGDGLRSAAAFDYGVKIQN